MSATLYASWVKTAAAVRFGVTAKELSETHKSPILNRARQIAMAVTKDIFPFVSYPELGRAFGSRHHSTAYGACRRVREMVDVDGVWRADFDAVRRMAIEIMPEDRRPA